MVCVAAIIFDELLLRKIKRFGLLEMNPNNPNLLPERPKVFCVWIESIVMKLWGFYSWLKVIRPPNFVDIIWQFLLFYLTINLSGCYLAVTFSFFNSQLN